MLCLRRATPTLAAHARLARVGCSAVLAAVFLAAVVERADGQTFGLDDCPVFPIVGPPGFGFGAEDPYGMMGPPLAPPASVRAAAVFVRQDRRHGRNISASGNRPRHVTIIRCGNAQQPGRARPLGRMALLPAQPRFAVGLPSNARVEE